MTLINYLLIALSFIVLVTAMLIVIVGGVWIINLELIELTGIDFAKSWIRYRLRRKK